MAYAMAEKPAIKDCQQCLDEKVQKAEMFCIDCRINLCINCVLQHKKVPLLAKHRFVSCDVEMDSVKESKSKDGKELLKVLKDEIQRDINNERTNLHKNPPSREVSKIVASVNTLGRMVENVQISGEPWNVRYIQGSISDILRNMKHVKTIDLPSNPYRLGTVNSDLWIRCSEDPITRFALYNSDLVKTGEIKYQNAKYTNTSQQVDSNHVIAASTMGLFVFNTKGDFLYKILDGVFSDINVANDSVTVVDCKNNKVIKLHQKNNRWQQCDQFTVKDSDKNIKTLHVHNEHIYVCISWSHKMYKYNNKGEFLEQFGKGQQGTQLGQFNSPYICGSDQNHCLVLGDSFNHRFLVLDTTQGKWDQIKVNGMEYPKDLLVVGNNIFILHGDIYTNVKLSKYCIMNAN